MDYKKPQDTLVHGGIGLYPLTTADQVILSDGSRLEKAGKINADKLDGRTLAEIMLALYPVGAVYISVNSTSPASLFGGTWTQIKGRFLIGTEKPENNDDGKSPGNYNYAAGSKGGEAAHKLTVNEMPTHSHNARELVSWGTEMTLPAWSVYTTSGTITDAGANGKTDKFWEYALTLSKGSDAAHNNMPPYLSVYMWKRVS